MQAIRWILFLPRVSYNYSASYVGIIYGAGGANTYITSGPATQLVNEIVGAVPATRGTPMTRPATSPASKATLTC